MDWNKNIISFQYNLLARSCFKVVFVQHKKNLDKSAKKKLSWQKTRAKYQFVEPGSNWTAGLSIHVSFLGRVTVKICELLDD